MRPLASRLEQIIPSASMAIAQKMKISGKTDTGRKTIDLTWGQPDFDTPDHIKKAAIDAILSGRNGYTASSGISELRVAISDFHKSRYGVLYDPMKEIIVTPGTKQGLMYLVQAIVNPGDEVILFEPCWLSYRDMILLNGGLPRFIPAGKKLKPDVSGIEDFINVKTKAILVNNPINPSGYVFSRSELEFIAGLAEKHDLYIIADEIYDRIVFTEFTSLSVIQSLRERVVVANGFSKAYAMTGWRIGYLLGCERLMSKVSLIHQHTATCAAAASQYAALEALKGDQSCVRDMCAIYQHRRDLFVESLQGVPFQPVYPQGTFYTLLDVSCMRAGTQSAEKLLKEYGVASVDGSCYGTSAAGVVRLSLTQNDAQLKEACSRLREGCFGTQR